MSASAASAPFNEAGPQGAGKRSGRQLPQLAAAVPSMRPARKGPENVRGSAGGDDRRPPFNEAGPQGAGKRSASSGGRQTPDGSFNEAGPQGAGKPDGHQDGA